MKTTSRPPRMSRLYCLVTAGLLGGSLFSLALLVNSCLHNEGAVVSPRTASELLTGVTFLFAACFQVTLRQRDAWSPLGMIKAVLAVLFGCLDGVFRLFTPLGQHGG